MGFIELAIIAIAALFLIFRSDSSGTNQKQIYGYKCDRSGSCKYIGVLSNQTLFHYYSSYDGWHSSIEFQGRLDYNGLTKMKLWTQHKEKKHILPIHCKMNIQSFIYKIYEAPNCADILSTNRTFECRPSKFTSKGLKAVSHDFISLDCDIHPSITLNYANNHGGSLKCKPYDYPTNKIRDARKCKFSMWISDHGFRTFEILLHVIRLVLFVAPMMMIFMNGCHFFILRRKLYFLSSYIAPIYGFYLIPLFLMYVIHCNIVTIVVVSMLELILSLIVIITMSLKQMRKMGFIAHKQ